MSQQSITEPPVYDLSNCDREPIHLTHFIQPHGVLLSLSEPEHTILQASSNAETYLGLPTNELLNQPLETVLPADCLEKIRAAQAAGQIVQKPHYIGTYTLQNMPLDVLVHRYGGRLLLELESVRDEIQLPEFYAFSDQTLEKLDKTLDVTRFCQVIAEEVRTLTGFDRVMIYRFDEDWNGTVIAEDKCEDLEPYKGLWYPASDIPKQARELYLRNWVRIIPNANAEPAPLIPERAPDTDQPIDLSHAVLRSLSPVHVEYLKNMGVVSSMSISVIKNGQLWGLIACHHTTPKQISYKTRSACEFMGKLLSLQLATKEDIHDQTYRQTMKARQIAITESMAKETFILDAFIKHLEGLKHFVDCEGMAVWFEGRPFVTGATPNTAQLKALTDWMASHHEQDVFAFNAITSHLPAAEEYRKVASGVLAMSFYTTDRNFVLWFRPEVIQTVDWAGDPNKPVSGPDHRISPRKSFELWKEVVRGKSLPWKQVEIEGVQDLRYVIMNIILAQVTEELSEVNKQLEASNNELDAFAYITSHDLKEPLRGLQHYAEFLLEDYGAQFDGEGLENIQTINKLAKRMDDLISTLLEYSRVGRVDFAYQQTDLSEVLEDILGRLSFKLRKKEVDVRVPKPLPTVFCDQIRIGEVFGNLIENAIKYNDKDQKWIEIGFLENAPLPTFYVRDNGIGIAEEHYQKIFMIFKRLHNRDRFEGGSGQGLTIAKKIVERHNGDIWVDSRLGEGTTFYFTLNVSPDNVKNQPKARFLP